MRYTIAFTADTSSARRRIRRPAAAADRAVPGRSSTDARQPQTTRSAPRRPPRPPHPNCQAPLLTPGRPGGGQPGLQHLGRRGQPPRARGVLHPRPRPHPTGTRRALGGRVSRTSNIDRQYPAKPTPRQLTAQPVDQFATVDNSSTSPRHREARRRRTRLEHGREVGTAAQHLAPVDIDHLTGDVAGRVAEQEHGRVRDVLDLAGPRQRRAGRVVAADLGRLEDRLPPDPCG